ncbi:hypothetical protein B4U80_12218, partial [Leptotrombidium deliense]
VYTDIKAAKAKLIKCKEDVKKEEVRLAAKYDFEKKLIEVHQYFNKNKDNLLTDDFKKLEKKNSEISKWLEERGDIMSEAEFKRKYLNLEELLSEIKKCLLEGEKSKTAIAVQIEKRFNMITVQLLDITKDSTLPETIQLNIDLLKQFSKEKDKRTLTEYRKMNLMSEEVKCDIKELQLIGKKNFILLTHFSPFQVSARRNDTKHRFLNELKQIKLQSPLLMHNDVITYFQYEQEFQEHVQYVEYFLEHSVNLTVTEMEGRFKILNSDKERFCALLSQEREERLNIMQNVNIYLEKLKKLRFDNRHLLNADGELKIREMVTTTEKWLLNSHQVSTADMKDSLAHLSSNFSQINTPIEN